MANPQKTIGALGGTFDHFHKGHEHFLEFASKQADHLIIGVTNQNLVREKELSSVIEPYEVRTEAVRRYCERLSRQQFGKKIDFEIVELTDPFGPTLGQREVDSLVVTELTVHGGELLNQKRKELGLSILPVAVSTMLHDESGKILNSTRIRQGVVNRTGQVYDRLFDEEYILQTSQKEFFKTPLGDLVTEPTGKSMLTAVVGDVCLGNFLQHHWSYQLGVFDKSSERQPISDSQILDLAIDITAKNPAGTIQPVVIQRLRELLFALQVMGNSSPKHLFIEGEEDLVTAALILMMPLGSQIYYGQPGVGMVRVWVSEELKERLLVLFSQNQSE